VSQALYTTGNLSANIIHTSQSLIFNKETSTSADKEYGELLAASAFPTNKKEEGALFCGITSLREIYEVISLEDAMTILRKHLSEEVIEGIKDEVDIRKLGAFILWFESLFGDIIHIIDMFPFDDIESGRLAFIEIDLDCNKKMGLKLSIPIKAYMNSEGFNDISRKVALICQK